MEHSSIPWPPSDTNGTRASEDEPRRPIELDKRPPPRKPMTAWDLVALSISMLGVQMGWSLELAYGTPYLLKLGLSDQATSLVWLAGPLSGLIAQPLIGALSDGSSSTYRRRSWVVGSTAVLVVTGFMLAYSKELAYFILAVTGKQNPNEDAITSVAIPIAITAFYLFDFAINGIQASLRNLLLDIVPQEQISIANAWQGRMLHAGNIVGNGVGFVDLSKIPIIRLVGGDQFRRFCILSLTVLVVCVAITVTTQHERPPKTQGQGQGSFLKAIKTIVQAITDLPRPIRRVCYVQLFAWVGWFPFLFYATTYVGQVMAAQNGRDPDLDTVTRTGELALFFYSIMAVIAGILLPYLASHDKRLLKGKEIDDEDEEDEEMSRIRQMVHKWRMEARQKGMSVKLPAMSFKLRDIWTASLVLFAILMFSTFFVKTVNAAIGIIILTGICWAVTCWVPFAIMMEYLREVDRSHARSQRNSLVGPRAGPARSASTSALRTGSRYQSTERTPLIRRYSLLDDTQLPEPDDLSKRHKPLAGGTVLGIHNLAIVFPQFVVSIVASMIFKFANQGSDPGDAFYGKNGVAWVLRFGGLAAMIAALLSRMVPPTKTEKEMRERLSEMAEAEADTTP